MKRNPHVLVAVLAVLGCVLVVSGWLLIGVLGQLLCAETVHFEVSSPDARYVAKIVELNCGATTPALTYVKVEDDQAFPLLRLLPPALSGTAKSVFSYQGRAERVSVRWLEPRALLLDYCVGSEVHQQETVWRDVVVEYRIQCR